MGHLTTEEVLAYLAGSLEEEGRFHLETHLADCRECLAKVHSYQVIREQFDPVWESWTARKHGEAVLRAHILESLSKAETDPARREIMWPWQERLRAWAARLSQKPLGALGVLLETSHQAVLMFREGLEDLCSPHLSPLEPVMVKARVRGVDQPQPAAVSGETPDSPWMKVTVDPGTKRITVQTEIVSPPWPLVIMVPKGRGPALIEELHHPPETDYLLAEFANIEGEYFLFLEAQDEDETC